MYRIGLLILQEWNIILHSSLSGNVEEITGDQRCAFRIVDRSLRDEVTGKWRKLHNEELNNLYSSPNMVRVIKSRRIRWAGHVARMGEGKGVYRVLVGKTERRRPLGRPRRRWKDNIRMDLW
jgi:hypothetical protein